VVFHGAYDPKAAGMPIADIRVRQALSMAIDRDEIGKHFFGGKMGPPSVPFFTLNTGDDVDMNRWGPITAQINRYDITEAKKLLKDAGYSDGFSINFWSYVRKGAPYAPRFVEMVAGYWLKIGVKTNIIPSDQGTYTPLRNTLTRANSPLLGQASFYSSTTNPLTAKVLDMGYLSTGSFGLLHQTRPDVDKLIQSVYNETDTTKRKELINKVLQIELDSYTALMAGELPSFGVLGPKVDVTLPKGARYLTNYADVFKHNGK
jgi:ABC-type transport system substrate-binding protein